MAVPSQGLMTRTSALIQVYDNDYEFPSVPVCIGGGTRLTPQEPLLTEELEGWAFSETAFRAWVAMPA